MPKQVRAYHLGVERDSVRQQSINSQSVAEFSFSVYTMMQALDGFASTIPDFKGDDPILAIPILAWVLDAKLTDDSSTGPLPGHPGLGQASVKPLLPRLLRRRLRRS
jgi:hypothetical protein